MLRDPWPSGSWQEYLHPRECILLGVALLLATSLVLVAITSIQDQTVEELRNWAQRPWEREDCKVHAVGIEYVGDCSNNTFATLRSWHRLPVHNYSSCVEHQGLSRDCRETVKREFVEGRRLAGGTDEQEEEEQAHREGAAPPRRLKKRGAHPGQMCRDRFLAWAFVQVPQGPRACAYRTGLLGESTVATWEEALLTNARLTMGGPAACWVFTLKSVGLLSVEDCPVVALQNPQSWPEVSSAPTEQFVGRVGFWLALCMAVIAVTVAAMHFGLPSIGTECYGGLANRLGLAATIEPLEAESERVRFVRDRWRLFRTSVLAEYQPVSSARDYARVPGAEPVMGWEPNEDASQ